MSSRDEGSAMVEFTFLAVLLLVPLVYLLLAAFEVQRAAYGLTAATEEGARVFVTAPDAGEGERRAVAAAAVALRDQGLDVDPESLRITCGERPCLSPRGQVTVRMATTVRLPLLPAALAGRAGGIVVRASHTQVVDAYRETRP